MSLDISTRRELLQCPVCLGEELRFRPQPGEPAEAAENGLFSCRRCRLSYPLVETIPVLLPPELAGPNLKETVTRFEEEVEFAELKALARGESASPVVPDLETAVAGETLPGEKRGRGGESGRSAGEAPAAEGAGLKAAERAARDREAEQYDELFDAVGRRSEEAALLGMLAPEREGDVLDLGCGTGRFTLPAARRCRSVTGVDFSLESLRRLRRAAKKEGLDNIFLLCADATKVPLPDGFFDGILSAQLLEHVPGEEGRRAVLAEVARLLKPEGRAVLDFYNWSFFQPRLTRRTQRVKEGKHGEIPFYRLHREEFRQLVESVAELELTRLTGVRSLTMLNLDRRLSGKLTAVGCALEAFLTWTRFALGTGYCLAAELRRRTEKE